MKKVEEKAKEYSDYTNMKELTARLVSTENYGKCRFYKLSHKITRGIYWGKEVDIPEETGCTKFRDEYKHLEGLSKDGVDVICISDADNFIERLVFAGLEYEKDGKTIYSRYNVVIDGKNTMSVYGGDYGSVYEPEVYIRHLARLNGLKYGGIIKQ